MTLPPRRLLLPILALGVGLLLIAGTFLAQRGGPAVGASGVGGPFRLTDQNGRAVTEADFAGAPMLVFFGYTHCPDVCPTTLSDLSSLLAALGPDKKAAVLFVTVDPERDTPAVLKAYLGSFDPRIVGLTGSPADVAKMIKAYRGYAAKVPAEGGDYTMDHTAIVYLMDKDGRFVRAFNPELEKPKDAAAAFALYL